MPPTSAPGAPRPRSPAARAPGPRAGRAPFRCLLLAAGALGAAGCGRPWPAAAGGTGAAGAPEPGRLARAAAARRGIDVLHYDLELDLRRLERRTLTGRARLRVRVSPDRRVLPLDFAGLPVDSVRVDGVAVRPRSRRGVLLLPLPGTEARGAVREVDVQYHGTPRDGLLFASDARGRPTAFADNWPNRARWWFPGNDHPSDKATVRFRVRAPAGWSVVANGLLVDSAGGLWTWETRAPIPTYTMVVGVAPFRRIVVGRGACGRAPRAPGGCAEVSVWALEGDEAFGARRFARAPDILDFFAGRIGPFPYGKLAHVESGTRFGGMENAGAIFYAREPWSRGTMSEGVVAHETAHQWFGDAVTPADWHELWLSEGFASYFGPLYVEARDGPEAFRALMVRARERLLRSGAVNRPVVDSLALEPGTDLFRLLNPNPYQKGAWVLHMLRALVGDSAFFRGVSRYYETLRDGNARTEDLRRALEEASGVGLDGFFRQWLYEPGFPRLRLQWRPAGDGRDPAVELRVDQLQTPPWPVFRFPLTVAVELGEGPPAIRTVRVRSARETFRLPLPAPPVGLRPDPRVELLAEITVRRGPGAGTPGGGRGL